MSLRTRITAIAVGLAFGLMLVASLLAIVVYLV